MKTPLQLLFIVLLVICCTDETYAQRLWYPDKDGDGLGDRYHPSQPSILPPTGSVPYVQNNLDCNDNFNTTVDWQTLGNEGFSAKKIWGASLGIDTYDNIYLAYRHDESGDKKIFVKKYSNSTGWIPASTDSDFPENGEGNDPILQVTSDGVPYVAYNQRDPFFDKEVIVKKFTGSNWENVGSNISGMLTLTVINLSFALDHNNVPYVAYSKLEPTTNMAFVYVKKFDGTNWTFVGDTKGIQADNSFSLNIHLDRTNIPYLAYDDGGHLHVKKFTNNSWNEVGDMSGSVAYQAAIRTDPEGIPYIAFLDGTRSIRVNKFSAGTWPEIANSSNYLFDAFDIEFNDAGEIFLAKKDQNGSCTVNKFNALNGWSAIGTSPISAGTVNSISMTLGTNGLPYVAYADLSPNSGGKASAKAFLPNYIASESPQISSSPEPHCSGTKDTLRATGKLNDAVSWQWSYDGNTVVADSLIINPTSTTTYFVMGDATCITPNLSGAITIRVTQLPEKPVITAIGSTTFCQGDSVILKASSTVLNPFYIWSNKPSPPSSLNDTIKASGDYFVQVRGNTKCLSDPSDILKVNVHDLPLKPVITSTDPLTFCAGDSAILRVSSSVTSPRYIWSNKPDAPSSDMDTIKTSGTYTVQVKDANLCTSPASSATIVTVNPLPVAPTITAGSSTTFCAGGSVTLTANSSVASPTYIWSDGTQATKLDVTTPGSYTVKVKDANLCTSPESNAEVVKVNALPNKPTITASGSTTFCAGGTVTLTANSSVAMPTYVWSNNTQAAKIDVINSGSYTVKVRDANLCTSLASDAQIVTVNALPIEPTITASGPTTFCAGGSVTLTAASSVPSPTYIWNDGTQSATFNAIKSGNYTVQVKDANSCTSLASNAAVVKVNALPTAPTIAASGSTTFCEGGSVTLTASSSITSPTYIWSGGAQGATLNVTKAGTYTVQVKDANLCTSLASAAQVVNVNALPTAPTIAASGLTTFCAGGSVTLTAKSSVASPTYIWNDGTQGSTINVTKGGSYSVQVKDANLCTSLASAAQAVTVNALPVKPTITANTATTFCAGDSVKLIANSSVASPSYLWSDGASTPTLNVTKAGSYTVKVKDGNQCTSLASNAQVVTVNALPAKPTIAPGGPTTFCSGKSVVLTASSGVTSPSYFWSNGNTNTAITATASGNYSVKVKDANLCISPSSDTIHVTVNAVPLKPTISAAGPTTFCAGDSVVLKAASTAASPAYVWSNGKTGAAITINAAGKYSVQVKDAGGCLSIPSDTQSVTVNALPARPTISHQGSDTLCAGDSVVLTAASSVISPVYIWSNGVTGSSIKVSASGNYTVRVTDGNHCMSLASDTQRIKVNALPTAPTIAASGPTAACSGGSVILTASSGVASPIYVWSNGSTGATLSVTQSGNYTVKVKDVNQCLSPASLATSVAISAPLAKPTIQPGGPTTFCVGDSVVLTASSTAASPTYMWSNGSTGKTITALAGGNYAVQLKDSNGCLSPASDSVRIAVNSIPATPKITPATALSFCQGDSVILKASAAITYLWNNQAGADTLIVRNGGTYTLTVQDANHCTSLPSQPVTVSIKPAPAKPVITSGGSLTFCQGDSVVLQAPTASHYSWSNQSSASSITVSVGGDYTVKIQNDDGCWSPESAPATIKVNPFALATDITVRDTSSCTGAPATLTATSDIRGAVFNWYSDALLQNKVGTGSPFTTAPLSSNATFYATVRGNGVCESKPAEAVVVNVALLTAPVLTVTPKQVTIAIGGSTQLTATGDGTIVWVPSTGLDNPNSFTPKASPTATTTYTATLTNSGGCKATDTARVEVTIAYFDYNKLITPNGDGINDRLAFSDIALYPDNKLEVFDRDGKLVYRKVGYNNEWDGRINGNVPPNNTYYFVLTVNGKVVRKGGVTIAH